MYLHKNGCFWLSSIRRSNCFRFFFNFTESRYEKRFPQALNFNGSWYPMVEIILHKRIPDMSLERQLNITSDYLFIILWNVDSLYNDIEYQAHKKNPRILINITSRNRALKLTLFSSLIAFFWKLNQILCEGISHGSSLNRTEESSVFALTKFSPCMLNTSSERRFGVEFSKHSVGFKMVCYHAVKRQIIYIFQANSPAFARLRPRIYTDRQGRGSNRWKCAPTCLSRFLKISWNAHPPNSDLKVPFCTNIHWAFGGERYKSGNIFISDQSNPGPKARNQLHPKLNFWWRFFDTLKIKKTREICVKSW